MLEKTLMETNMSVFAGITASILIFFLLWVFYKEYKNKDLKFNSYIIYASLGGIFFSIFLLFTSYIVYNKINEYNEAKSEISLDEEIYKQERSVYENELKDYESKLKEYISQNNKITKPIKPVAPEKPQAPDYIGTFGDLIGGSFAPAIGLLAALTGGLAFFAQYKANQDIKDQFKLQQFESQFFEMLRLHKDNVNNMKIDGYKFIQNKNEKMRVDYQISGYKTFVTLIPEFEAIFKVIKLICESNKALLPSDAQNKEDVYNQFLMDNSFYIFFNGLKFYKDNLERLSTDIPPDTKEVFINIDLGEKILKKLQKLQNKHEKFGIKNYKFKNNKKINLYFNFKPFTGHINILSHYYRHLYQTCKYVVNQDDAFLTYEQKRNYLKILRSNISSYEQILLYYNWLGFGVKWEEKLEPWHEGKYYNSKYKFFTDYRMIHNIPNTLVIDEFKIDKYFDKKYTKNMKFMGNSINDDALFEDVIQKNS